MTAAAPKLLAIGLEQSFLRMVQDQLSGLFGNQVRTRTLALNEIEADPPQPDETILYFNRGLAAMVEKVVPKSCHFVLARREALVFNMQVLFSLTQPCRILVVNDVKTNTDEMTRELEALGLDHTFVPYHPDQDLPQDIDYVVTAGERMLVPPALSHCPVMDIGLRFISISTVFHLFALFGLEIQPADLARHYMRTMMMVSERWPVLGNDRLRYASRLGRPSHTRAEFTLAQVTAKSPAMKALCLDLSRMAPTGHPVHIFGRTGTGKTCLAQALHNASVRSSGPFVAINCAARSGEVLDRELFGWEQGEMVFKGLFEEAAQGTLCIEEVGQLPASLQARLLQALSENRIIRSGGQGHVPVTARIVTTSSLDLEELKAAGVNPGLIVAMTSHVCRVPTLAERSEDFEDLIAGYLAGELNRPGQALPAETLAVLRAHDFEGNVQELFNVVQHLVCMARDQSLDTRFLPYYLNRPDQISERPAAALPPGDLTQFQDLARELTRHGFLDETQAILSIYLAGKEQNRALGRNAVLEALQKNGYALSVQQLRLKLERMDHLGLLIVRPGRGGTTLSDKGQNFLEFLTGPGAGSILKEQP